MKTTKITWISFIVTLSALTIPTKTIAHNNKPVSENQSQAIESRLSKIAKTLKERETRLLESSDTETIIDLPEDIDLAGWLKGRRGGWIKSRGGGFLNNRRRGGGGFLNRRRWPDRGGFVNRRYRY